MDIELATKAKFEGTEEAGGLQFLASGDDTGKGLIGAKAQSILAKNGALI